MINPLPGYRFRPIQPHDLIPIYRLLADNAQRTEAVPPVLETIQGMLTILADLLPDTSRLALTPDEQLAGYVFLIPSWSSGSMEVHIEADFNPDHQSTGLPDQLFSWVEQRLDEFAEQKGYTGPARLRVGFNELRKDLIDLYTARGFEPFITQIRLQRDLSLPIPAAPLPEGMVFRAYQDQDSEPMRLVLNESFTDHWIGELSPGAWRERFIDTGKFRPDLTYLVWQGNRLAGFYLSENNPDQPTQGWLEVMAVAPEFRRRGIGIALLNHALRSYHASGFLTAGLDVDLENKTNALRLYERAGFTKVQGTCYFVRWLSMEKSSHSSR